MTMQSTATAELRADDAPPAVATQWPEPNEAGIYENPEKVFIPLPVGNNCGLYLVQVGPEKWRMGYILHMRSPKVGPIEALVKADSDSARSREAALRFLATGVAKKFFHDHKEVLARIDKWLAETFPAETSQVETVAAPAGDAVADTVIAGRSEASPEPSGAAAPTESRRGHFASIRVADIERGANPRKQRSKESFNELVESIRAQGELLQPIAVRDLGEHVAATSEHKRYQLIFGEGRWLAHQHLAWEFIDAKVYVGVDAGEVLAMALVENLQREDMNPMDEAEGFAELARLGYSPDRMAAKTGKAERTIRGFLGLMKLPDSVRQWVRDGELSARQARSLLQWVARPANVAEADFVARPQVCEIIADCAGKSACNISSDELAVGVPSEAVGALVSAGLSVEIAPEYHGAVLARDAVPLAMFEVAGRRFTFDVEPWKEFKKRLDGEARAAAKKKTAKAAGRAAIANESKVSVPLGTLQQGRVQHVVLKGDLEKFTDYLPEDCVSKGIDEDTKAEVMVCTRPAALADLKIAYQSSVGDDRDQKFPALMEACSSAIKRLKKIGPREMAFIVERAGTEGATNHLRSEAWKAQGVRFPGKVTIEANAKVDSVQLARVFIHSALDEIYLEAEGSDNLEPFFAAVRWILNRPRLGLIEEDRREQDKLLTRLAAGLWPKSEAKPQAPASPKPEPKKPAKKSGKK